MLPDRASGIQLHLTSLPDGRLGASARWFVDWLAEAGQTVWQVLPMSVPDAFGSPYASPSAFAANAGLLEHPDAPVDAAEVRAFAERHAYWAQSWVAHGGSLADQVRFDREWGALRAYAKERGISILGDVPIYVAQGGADVRAWPQYFRSDAVAGVPPDFYAATGQLWGNPLYDWDALAADGHRWWIERLRRTFDLYDLVRIDHFRAFSDFWAVPAGDITAERGVWEPGPGRAVFDAAAAELGDLPVLAEDLGDIDDAVIELRDALGFPGMAVLQFAFQGGDDATHEPANLTREQVVYTGTHDNDTVNGWWAGLPRSARRRARRAMRQAGVGFGVRRREPSWALIEIAQQSPSRLAMAQAQDVLGLGSGARMNTPGTASTWGWRLTPGQLTHAHAARLRSISEETGRS